MESYLVKSDYYLVFINPLKHKHEWNRLKLILTIAEAKYTVYKTDSNIIRLHPISKDEYITYNYNPN